MNKRKRFLLVNILGILSISVPLTASDSPDARKVLRRFAEARKNFTSFILETEAEKTFNNPQSNWSGVLYGKAEHRLDSNRRRVCWSMWGKVDIYHPNVSRNQAHYGSNLWDGKNFYWYTHVGPSRPSSLVIRRTKDEGIIPKEVINLETKGGDIVSEMLGYHWGDNAMRIDEVLGRAEHLKLRENQENLRGVDCYVIDAEVKGKGKYTVWIDPAHDYHIAKIHVRRGKDDHVNIRKLKENDSSDEMYEILRFQQIGDLWFPLEYKMVRSSYHGETGISSINEIFTNITNIVLNPNHDALKSFTPYDIPNGAVVRITAFPPSIKFIWQDGKVVDKTGRVIMDSKTKKPAGSTKPKSKSQTKKHPTALELLDKYTQALESFRSIIVKAESTSEHEYRFSKNWNESGYRGVGDAGTSYKRTEFRTDGERMHMRTYHWGHINSRDSSVSEEQPMYICHNYANGQLYRNSAESAAPGAKGFVKLNKAQYMGIRGGLDKFLTGYVIQTWERVDSILRRAESISVRPKTESVGGSDCYVIYAKTDSGRISLWIDPEHGYNVARAEARGTQGNLYYGRPLTRGQVVSSCIEHVRFEKIDGIWVPMEMDFTMDNHLGPGSFTRQKCHYKRTEVVINPDHETLGSFDNPLENPENDPLLRNGTRVQMEGGLRGVWLNGKVVDKQGRVIADFRKNAGKAHEENNSDAKR